MNSDFEEEISEFVVDVQDQPAVDSVSDDLPEQQQRTSRRLPEQWTRIISFSAGDD